MKRKFNSLLLVITLATSLSISCNSLEETPLIPQERNLIALKEISSSSSRSNKQVGFETKLNNLKSTEDIMTISPEDMTKNAQVSRIMTLLSSTGIEWKLTEEYGNSTINDNFKDLDKISVSVQNSQIVIKSPSTRNPETRTQLDKYLKVRLQDDPKREITWRQTLFGLGPESLHSRYENAKGKILVDFYIKNEIKSTYFIEEVLGLKEGLDKGIHLILKAQNNQGMQGTNSKIILKTASTEIGIPKHSRLSSALWQTADWAIRATPFIVTAATIYGIYAGVTSGSDEPESGGNTGNQTMTNSTSTATVTPNTSQGMTTSEVFTSMVPTPITDIITSFFDFTTSSSSTAENGTDASNQTMETMTSLSTEALTSVTTEALNATATTINSAFNQTTEAPTNMTQAVSEIFNTTMETMTSAASNAINTTTEIIDDTASETFNATSPAPMAAPNTAFVTGPDVSENTTLISPCISSQCLSRAKIITGYSLENHTGHTANQTLQSCTTCDEVAFQACSDDAPSNRTISFLTDFFNTTLEYLMESFPDPCAPTDCRPFADNGTAIVRITNDGTLDTFKYDNCGGTNGTMSGSGAISMPAGNSTSN